MARRHESVERQRRNRASWFAIGVVATSMAFSGGCKSSSKSDSGQGLGETSAKASVPLPILDCTLNAPPEKRRISVIPDNPPKNSQWGFSVHIIPPKTDIPASAWGEVYYKNDQRGGQTYYAYGSGMFNDAPPHEMVHTDIPLYSLTVSKDLNIKVYTPPSGKEGTINFACDGGTDKRQPFTPYYVTFELPKMQG